MPDSSPAPRHTGAPAPIPLVQHGVFAAVPLLLASLFFMAPASASTLDVMPLPAKARLENGRLAVTAGLTVALAGPEDTRVAAAVDRALLRWEQRTGLTFPRTAAGPRAHASDPAPATVVVSWTQASPADPRPDEDESYDLEVGTRQAVLRAATSVGAIRGLETLLQLLQSDAGGWYVTAVSIHDQPRFPWRGLMLDVCRHWLPIEVVKRNLDAMAVVKLNVLHLHLTEDQGFRIESRRYPRLHELGSDGLYFTQEQMREIIAYAAARGIRVVPEFDLPGHATAWVVGHPELASAPGPYVIERTWGVFDPTLDPTNEAVYTLLDGFFGEMAALFPDPYLHIGGDENNGKQWTANPRIQAFVKEHGLVDNHGLQAWFNRRLQEILTRHGKRMIGWDEILHPDIPTTAVIQSWRGAHGLAEASRAGHTVILSNGYYIDLIESTARHYLNDPLPADTPLTAEQQARVLGGEATMWAEWVTPETVDSRIWPRTAAIAERLWSQREVNDVDDMYRRLDYVSRRLSEVGTLHERNREFLLRRYAGDRATPAAIEAVRDLLALVEPVKGYQRGREQPGFTQHTPLTGLADCAQPDSARARKFAKAVDAVVFGDTPAASLEPWFAGWQELAARLRQVAPETGPRSGELLALAAQLASMARADVTLDEINRAAAPQAAVELAIVDSLRLLAAANTERAKRASLSPAAWRERIETLAFPEPAP